MLQPANESVIIKSSVPSDFLSEGQDSGLWTVHPFLTKLLQHMAFSSLSYVFLLTFNDEVDVIRNGWTPEKVLHYFDNSKKLH